MTITRKIKRIVLIKSNEKKENKGTSPSTGNITPHIESTRNERNSSTTTTPDLTPLVIDGSTSSSMEDCSSLMGQDSPRFTNTTLNSPALDYSIVKATKVSSFPQKSNNVDEHNMYRPFISKTPRGIIQSTPSSISSPGSAMDDSSIETSSAQPKEHYTRSNTVIGGGLVMKPKVGSAITPVTIDEDCTINHNDEPRLKKTKSASTITVKKKVVIYTQPQKSEITAPPILENVAKFSFIEAVNNEEERLQKIKVEEFKVDRTDEDSTSPVNVYSPRAFENGLHLTPKPQRPSLEEYSGNPSKLYAFLEDGDLRSASPRRGSTIDEHRRSTISKSDENSSMDLIIPPELEKNVGNYGHFSLEKFVQERNKHRVHLRGIHSLGQKLDEKILDERGPSGDKFSQQENYDQWTPSVKVSHNTFETNEESTKITSYQLSNCSNVQNSQTNLNDIKSFYPLPEGLLSFQIKSQSNEERQMKILFKAKRPIDSDLHKIMMEIISQDSSEERIHDLENYEWSLTLETTSDIPTSREVLRKIISENQKDTSQGFQFKSFSHLSTFIGNSVQEEMKKRALQYSSTGDNMRMALVFSQNDFIPNSNGLEYNVQGLLNDEKVLFNFTDCLETHYRKEMISCSGKILFLCVQFYSSLLDSDIQFKLPLYPHCTIENTKKELAIQNLEEQVSQLELELEEILYQKYMWEFLMKYTFKVFDSRIIDTTKVSISNQKRTLKYTGEKVGWTSCVCRCPITPGRFVDTNLETNSGFPGDLSSLKTNHVLTLRLDSFPEGSDIYVGIINANHTADHILQNYVVSGKSDSHTFFLKEKQFRHGSMIINSMPNNTEYSWAKGDILQVVLDYSNMNIQVYRNYNQRIFPTFEATTIDLENTEWYFVLGLNQIDQQVTLI